MRITGYLSMLFLFIAITGCNGQTGKNSGGNKSVSPVSQVNAGNDGLPRQLTKQDFLKMVMNYEKNTEVWVYEGNKPCLVDFYADWCGPCKLTSPILEELSKQYGDRINFYKVDIDEEQELAAIFGIQSIPTFLFCPMDGQPTMSSGIARSKEETKQMFIKQIEELLLKKDNSSTTI
ncbi:MAG TPA: thioredoxin [Bacteroidales bacterium]|nr:thioredoxin [Bacteroidales bacterium]